MAGGAQALMADPSSGQGQGRSVLSTPLDGFVREYLSTTLMSMQPRDGVVAEPEQTWCLADDYRESVLLYSLAGTSIILLRALPPGTYVGIWFDPRSGSTRPLETALTNTIEKPTGEQWLLLLRVRGRRPSPLSLSGPPGGEPTLPPRGKGRMRHKGYAAAAEGEDDLEATGGSQG
jgi:hypothetical protein